MKYQKALGDPATKSGKELGIDILHFDYDPKTQYIETAVGKKIGEKNQIIIKNKATNGELIFLRELLTSSLGHPKLFDISF